MGEIAEMMLDGTLCAGCGRALMGHGNGDPRFCKDCRKEETAARHEAHQAAAKRAKCPHCHRKVKLVGLQDHIRDAHGGASAEALVRAAAPDLLAALLKAEDLVAHRWGYPDDASSRASILAELRAAIGKATGSAA